MTAHSWPSTRGRLCYYLRFGAESQIAQVGKELSRSPYRDQLQNYLYGYIGDHLTLEGAGQIPRAQAALRGLLGKEKPGNVTVPPRALYNEGG